MFNVDQRN